MGDRIIEIQELSMLHSPSLLDEDLGKFYIVNSSFFLRKTTQA
jgi:hypothetical protein